MKSVLFQSLAVVLLTLTLAGCASTPPADGGDPRRFFNDQPHQMGDRFDPVYMPDSPIILPY